MLVLSSIGLVLLSPSFFRLRRVVVLSPLHLQGGVAFAASSFSVVVLSRYLLSGGGVLLPFPHPSPSPSRTSFFHTWCDDVASIKEKGQQQYHHPRNEERTSAPARSRRCGQHPRNEEARKAQPHQGGDEGSATQRRTREGTTTH